MIYLDTYYSSSQFRGASGSQVSREGYVPKAQASDTRSFLRGDGTWMSAGFRSTQTSTFSAYPGDFYAVNTTSSQLTGHLPESPDTGTTITFQDPFLTWQINNFILSRSNSMIMGLNENMICDRGGVMFSVTYVGGSVGWRVS